MTRQSTTPADHGLRTTRAGVMMTRAAGEAVALDGRANMNMPDWTREYFERGYAQRWGLPAPQIMCGWRPPAVDLLQLSPTSRIIDIGCGHGRHALALAERGAEVIGLDFAVALLNRARHLAAELRTRVRWIRGDMRRLPFRSGCADAAIVMDAFGFFDTEEEHEAVLREAARVVTTGGRLALKVVNGGPVLDDFRETEREERDGVVVSVSNTLTFDPPRMTQRISVSGSRGQGEIRTAPAPVPSRRVTCRSRTRRVLRCRRFRRSGRHAIRTHRVIDDVDRRSATRRRLNIAAGGGRCDPGTPRLKDSRRVRRLYEDCRTSC